MAYSERLREVLGEPDGILAGVSGNKASVRVARRTERELSANTILKMKEGTYGRLDNVRILGRAYATEILEKHRREIESTYNLEPGTAAVVHVEDWLALVATSLQSTAGKLTGLTESPQAPADEIWVPRDWVQELARYFAKSGFHGVSDPRATGVQRAEFAQVFREVFKDESREELKKRVFPNYWIDGLFEGFVPHVTELRRIMREMKLDAASADRLMIAAGYGHWNPTEAVKEALGDLVYRFDDPGLLDGLDLPDNLAVMGPADIDLFVWDVELEYVGRRWPSGEPWSGDEKKPNSAKRRIQRIVQSARRELRETIEDVLVAVERDTQETVEEVDRRWRYATSRFWPRYEAYLDWCRQNKFHPRVPAIWSETEMFKDGLSELHGDSIDEVLNQIIERLKQSTEVMERPRNQSDQP